MNRRSALVFGLLCVALASSTAAAQARDSIPHWTARLAEGSLAERVHAARALAGFDARRLPPETKAAFIAELDRIHTLRLARAPLEGEELVPRETFGRYYIDLVATTVAFNTAESEDAVVRAVAVSGGLQRRVARRGDVAAPMLAEMIERGYHPDAAVETLGLIWFHSDSAGTPLAPETRALIVRHLLGAVTSADFAVRRSAVIALRATADPAFLPLAEHLVRRSNASGDRTIARAAQQEAVSALRNRARLTPAGELTARVARVAVALCERPETDERGELCAALLASFTGNRGPARPASGAPGGGQGDGGGAVATVATMLDIALSAGTLREDEHALLAGGARLLAGRSR